MNPPPPPGRKYSGADPHQMIDACCPAAEGGYVAVGTDFCCCYLLYPISETDKKQ